MPTTWEDLYREHAAPVWRYVRARLSSDADAEDVTSDVFLRAYRSMATYDPSHGSSRGWLVGIARHAVADWWRRRARDEPIADPPAGADPESDPVAAVLHHEEVGELGQALTTLSDREREAIALRFGAELRSEEVGRELGISAPAARMLVHRAVVKLRGEVDHD